MSRVEFEECLSVITRKVGDHLQEEGMKVFDKMTEDEKSNLNPSVRFALPFYLAKLITCCVLDTVEGQFASESMKPLFKKVNKIRSSRP